MSTVSGTARLVVESARDAIATAGERFTRWVAPNGTRRQQRIEADLDRKQAELRTTILRLAEALGMDAHEARKALIRESFLASGRVPDESSGS